jgi:Ca-activated chloride channel family protein
MQWNAAAVETQRSGGPEAFLLVTAEASGDEARAPVMVNLLLDRSGSMKGAPLAAAIEAAMQFVDLARNDDYLGLLLFDGVVEQRVPVCPMDARGKKLMAEALQDVHTGRGTALFSAIDQGAKALSRVLVPGRKPRLLLLTDGEPSVGPDTQTAFDDLGLAIARDNVSIHALGLARHYVAEVLAALTLPSGNAFEHVDGPEGLAEAMGAVVTTLFGQVASNVSVRIQPEGFGALSCRHGFPSRAESDALVVTLGDVSRGLSRRVLLSGPVLTGQWSASIVGSSVERGDQRHQRIDLQKVSADSATGRAVLSLSHELELVAEETAAWLSLARKEPSRAESQLEKAEAALREIVTLASNTVPVRRHLERLGDLRVAVERGEGDIPLLIRRAQSARAGTHVSQVIPLAAYRGLKK